MKGHLVHVEYLMQVAMGDKKEWMSELGTPVPRHKPPVAHKFPCLFSGDKSTYAFA
jgi:hypothetical protein